MSRSCNLGSRAMTGISAAQAVAIWISPPWSPGDIGSHVCFTLLSAPPSAERSCASLTSPPSSCQAVFNPELSHNARHTRKSQANQRLAWSLEHFLKRRDPKLCRGPAEERKTEPVGPKAPTHRQGNGYRCVPVCQTGADLPSYTTRLPSSRIVKLYGAFPAGVLRDQIATHAEFARHTPKPPRLTSWAEDP